MDTPHKINKKKGVEICADYIYEGKARKEIVQICTENYGVSVSAVEKWMTAARPIVEERRRKDEVTRQQANAEAVAETARRLNISRERVLEEYAKVAFLDPSLIFNEDRTLKDISELDKITVAAIAGFEIIEDKSSKQATKIKLKLADKLQALDGISNIMGYKAAVKTEGKNVNENINYNSKELTLDEIKAIGKALEDEC